MGGVSERLKELVLKTSDARKGTVGSNPTPSATGMRRDGREVEGGRLLSDCTG